MQAGRELRHDAAFRSIVLVDHRTNAREIERTFRTVSLVVGGVLRGVGQRPDTMAGRETRRE
jgi:hypothetical protein